MNAWEGFTTAALLGSEKASASPLPPVLEAELATVTGEDRETAFLTRAGALALWRRSGFLPAHDQSVVPLASPETTVLLSQASIGHLRAMLGGRAVGILPEWLRRVALVKRHVSPEFLPLLLDRARQDRSLRPLVLAAGGHRAEWLAAQYPGDFAVAAPDSPAAWETGTPEERLAHLRRCRAEAPDEARAKVEAVWKTEPAETRAAFTRELSHHLSLADEAFLEAALDDRSKEVQRVAVNLLARLSGSALAGRMTARAIPLFTFRRGGLLSRAALEVTLPAEPDAAGMRDGLDPKAFGSQKALGERAVLLVQTVAAVPLNHWTEAFRQTPAEILKALEKSEFARAVVTGWTWAALRQEDIAWAEAFLNSPVAPHAEFLSGASPLSVLPEAARAHHLLGALRSGALDLAEPAKIQTLLGQLHTFGDGLPTALARELLTALKKAVAEGIPWSLRSFADFLALRLPPGMLGEALTGWPAEKENVAALVDLLTFRHDALAALIQP